MPQDLTPQLRSQLDSNIKSMLANGASQEDVMSYATDFNSKYNAQKKNSLNGGGTELSTQQNQNGIGNFQQLKNSVAQVNLPQSQNSNLGVDTGMQAPDKGAIKVQEQKTLKQAINNTAHQYFNNNKPLLKQLSKTNENIIAKDKEGKDIQDEYNPDQLEKTAAFQNKVKEINNAVQSGNLTLTHYQNGANIGKPVLTKPEGFLGSLGSSIANSFGATKDAIIAMTKNPKELADYYDEQRKDLPEIPESTPVGVGSMVGGAIGGMIKPVAEFAAGEALQPEGGGLITAAADIIPTTTSEKTKEIYNQRMNILEGKYGKGNVPESERLDAIQKAQDQAPLQALPNEAMQLYLFGKGAGGLGDAANKEAIESFGKVLQKSGADIGKMAALGGTSELATQGIKQAQSGNGEFDKNISEAAGQWAMMEAAFKTLPIASKALGTVFPKFVSSNAKNVLATADPEVVQKLSEQAVRQGWLTQDQADATVKDVNDFAKIKQTMPDNLSQTKQASIGGLIQKNEALEAEKETKNPIFHDDIDAEIKSNEEKAKQILNSNQPLKYETDNLTGERAQNIGGRPTKGEPENISQPIELNPEITNETQTEKPIEEGTLGSTAVNEPKGIPTVEGSKTEENVGEDIQPQQENKIIKPNWNYEGEGQALASNKDLRNGKSAYTIRILDSQGSGDSYYRAKQRGELDTKSPITYKGDNERMTALDGNGNTVGVVVLDGKGGTVGVQHIVVAPEFERKGIATEMINKLKENGAKIDFSKSDKISPDAANFFNKFNEQPKENITENIQEQKQNTETEKQVNDLENQKYNKMKDDIKGETKLNLIPSKELVKAKEPIEAKKTHDDIKERYKTLKKLIDCL